MGRTVCNMLCISLLLTSVSCLEDTFSSAGKSEEADVRIATDVERVGLPAEFIDAQDTVFTVTVTSNRSWFVHLNDVDNPVNPSDVQASVSWASVDLDDHENLTKVDDEVEVKVNVTRNKTTEQRNAVLNFYCDGKIHTSLPIIQAAAVYRLSADAQADEALCTPSQVGISINTNTSWTAELLPESTASVTLSADNGFDSGEIILQFEENFQTVEKKAFVKITAQGCEPQIVEITQSKALPYLIVDHDRTMTDLPADISETNIYLKTNLSDVNAQIKDGATLTDARIEKISDTEFKFTCTPDGNDPQVYKNAVVVITVADNDEVEDIELGIKQNGLLHFYFRTAENISPQMPTAATAVYSSHVLIVGDNNYEFGIEKFYHRTSNCLMFYKGGYIALPAVEGKTLKKITFTFRGHKESYNRAPRFTIKGMGDDADTSYSASNVSFDVPSGANDYVTYTLEVGTEKNRPQPGVAYRICQHSSYSCQVRDMWLQYE